MGRDPRFLDRLDLLKVAAEEICVVCVREVRTARRSWIWRILRQSFLVLKQSFRYGEDNAGVSEYPVHEN